MTKYILFNLKKSFTITQPLLASHQTSNAEKGMILMCNTSWKMTNQMSLSTGIQWIQCHIRLWTLWHPKFPLREGFIVVTLLCSIGWHSRISVRIKLGKSSTKPSHSMVPSHYYWQSYFIIYIFCESESFRYWTRMYRLQIQPTQISIAYMRSQKYSPCVWSEECLMYVACMIYLGGGGPILPVTRGGFPPSLGTGEEDLRWATGSHQRRNDMIRNMHPRLMSILRNNSTTNASRSHAPSWHSHDDDKRTK